MAPASDVSSPSWHTIARDTAVFVLVFALLGWAWLAHVTDALPLDESPEDGWFILWVLDWCRHALTTAPGRLFDPPINFPSPAQLAGSEHFLSSQLLYAPLYWVTGSPVVAANLTAFLCYPLASVAMAALLRTLSVPTGQALVCALLYGFGFTAVPGRLHIVQIEHVWLPLMALMLDRVRDRVDWRRWLALVATLTSGLFSSYHMAVYLSIAATLWTVGELARDRPGRGRFAVAAATAWLVAAGLLLAVSRPYFARPEGRGEVELTSSRWGVAHLGADGEPTAEIGPVDLARQLVGCLVLQGRPAPCLVPWSLGDAPSRAGVWTFTDPALFATAPLVALGVVTAVRRRTRDARVGAALAVAIAGTLLAGAAYCAVGGIRIPLLRALLARTPARVIRVHSRGLVLTFFGAIVVAARGLAFLSERAPRLGRTALVLLAVAAPLHYGFATGARPAPSDALAGRVRFAPLGFQTTPALGRDRPQYEAVAAHAHRIADGPLLEWPARDTGAAVVGQMFHRLPSIVFYTGYMPPHVPLVKALVGALPNRDALDDLIDMTGLAWILVPPAADWRDPARYAALVGQLTAHPRTRAVTPFDDFLLVQLDARSHHPQWFEAIARGPRTGTSVLGTPLAPVPAGVGFVAIEATVPRAVPMNAPFTFDVTVLNATSVPLPAASPDQPGRELTVHLEARWLRADVSGGVDGAPQIEELRRDVPAFEPLHQHVVARSPTRPGRYDLELRVCQVGGGNLVGTSNPVRRAVMVVDGSS